VELLDEGVTLDDEEDGGTLLELDDDEELIELELLELDEDELE